MAVDSVNRLMKVCCLPDKKSVTKHLHLHIHGYKKNVDYKDPLYIYGPDKTAIINLIKENQDWGKNLSDDLEIIKAQVIWAVREEMARNTEDFLARRTRALFLDDKDSIRMAQEIAIIMAKELGKNNDWEKIQIQEYTNLAEGYLLK